LYIQYSGQNLFPIQPNAAATANKITAGKGRNGSGSAVLAEIGGLVMLSAVSAHQFVRRA